MFSLNKKIAIVTGSKRGNGKAIAAGLTQMGATVYGLDVEFSTIPNSEEYSRQVYCDITRTDKFKEICEKIYGEHKRIDILVNNAGCTLPKEANIEGLYPIENWHRTLQVNLTAPFECSQVVFGYMKKNNGGSIINLTSLSAKLGFPNNPAYAASKGGLRMLSKSLAAEWAQFGIRVNNIVPGYIHTEMTRMSYEDEKIRNQRKASMMIKRWGEPEDLIGACVFLASRASSYITGQDIYVDGGWTAKGFPDFEEK